MNISGFDILFKRYIGNIQSELTDIDLDNYESDKPKDKDIKNDKN